METRQLGQSSIKFAPIAFGGNVFGWTADEAASFKLLDQFVASGFTFIDTADVYSRWVPGNTGGESEVIIGKWLKARGGRDRVIIATKLGMELAPDKKGLSKAYMMRAVEDSLKRLQTDYIDLYQSHRDDPATPQQETLEGYAKLMEQGKVRVIGASNFTAARLAEALEISKKTGLPRYESLQPLYSLVERKEFEGDLEQLCLKEKVGVIGYYSLASGFLSGKYRSENDLNTARGSRVKAYLNDRGFRVLKALDDIAAAHKASPTQVALAWLIARPSVTAPIVSATNAQQLAEVLKSTEVKLNRAEIDQLDKASAA